MRVRWPRFVAGLVLATAFALAAMARAETIASDASIVAVRDLKTNAAQVSGVLVNQSARLVREVRLVIRYAWLWNDERHPGYDNPGRAVNYTVPGDIPPGGSLPFAYRPDSPLPSRSDGHFQTSVDVVGYTEVGE